MGDENTQTSPHVQVAVAAGQPHDFSQQQTEKRPSLIISEESSLSRHHTPIVKRTTGAVEMDKRGKSAIGTQKQAHFLIPSHKPFQFSLSTTVQHDYRKSFLKPFGVLSDGWFADLIRF